MTRGGARLGFAALLLLAVLWAGWRALRREPSSPTSVTVPPANVPAARRDSPSALAPSPSPSPRAEGSSPAAAPDPESNLRELERLAASDKARALQLALAADAQLPSSGVMAEARRALIVTLLVDQNQYDEARARARSFTAQYPTSRYLPLVQGVSGVHPRPRPSELHDARAPER